jgi:hypothetical protein
MKKSKKLALRKQTVATLTPTALASVVGGSLAPQGFIMRDTIIIRTGGGIIDDGGHH